MTKLHRSFAAILAVGSLSAVFASTVFAGPVTETKPECSLATALLLGGDGSDGDTKVTRIRSYLEAKQVWTIGTAKENTSGEVGLVEYQVSTPYKGGPTHVYGVECGTGVDCNNIAKGFAEKNPDSSPMVFCGESTILTGKSAR